MLVPFRSLDQAAEAVNAIFLAGFTPSALELMEIDALKITSEFIGSNIISIDDDIAAHLIIEVDGNHLEILTKEMETISELLTKYNIGDIFFAEDDQQKNQLWKLRRKVAEVVKMAGYTIEEDTVVPRAALPQLIHEVKALGKKYNFETVCYGHAGDGNLHIRIKKKWYR